MVLFLIFREIQNIGLLSFHLKKGRGLKILSIFEYSALISIHSSIMDNSKLTNRLRPHLFEEERGKHGK